MSTQDASAADTGMDSLLKEIDQEMENTMATIKLPTSNSGKWRLPLQDIGDETMEMIVKHNTTKNINLTDSYQGGAKTMEDAVNESDKEQDINVGWTLAPIKNEQQAKEEIDSAASTTHDSVTWRDGIATRLSSNSSTDRESQLVPPLADDRYNLLETPKNPVCNTTQLVTTQTNSFETFKPSIFYHNNASNIFSVATTADEYKSAVENEEAMSSTNEADQSNLSLTTSEQSSLLPGGVAAKQALDDNNETIADIKLETEIASTKTEETASDRETKVQIPKTEQDTPAHNIPNMKGENTEEEEEEGKKEKEEEGEKKEATEELTEGEPKITIKTYEQQPHIDTVIEQLVATENEKPSPLLPPLPRLASIFIEDPFQDEFETTSELINVAKPTRPSDYLSIWHIQEDRLKRISSPTTSYNSQFSNRTASTGSSSLYNGLNIPSFSFKPRIISRSRIYNPESRLQGISISKQLGVGTHSINRAPNMNENTLLAEQNNPTRVSSVIHKDPATSLNDNKPFAVLKDEPSFDLLPSFLDAELSFSFSKALDMFDKESIVDEDEEGTHVKTSNTVSSMSIWNGYEDVATEADNFIPDDVLNKLLRPDSILDKAVNDQSTSSLTNGNFVSKDKYASETGLGILKSPIDNITIGRGISLNGFEVMLSDDESVTQKPYLQDLDLKPLPQTPTSSPIKSNHIDSPFKVIKKPKEELEVMLAPKDKSIESIPDGRLSLDQKKDATIELPEKAELTQASKLDTSKLTDKGSIYINIINIRNIKLHAIRHHEAKYAIELENGKNVVQTPWKDMPGDGKLDVGKEFQLILENDLNITEFTLTLKCRYSRPKTEIVEVIERVPVSDKRKMGFWGKPKFVNQRKYVQRAAQEDDWAYLFAQDGSFARCKIQLTEDFLNKIMFAKEKLSLPMENVWSRQIPAGRSDQRKLYDQSRRQPYTAALIELEACYLQRVSSEEIFPKNINAVNSVLTKYTVQQNIQKEGYLLQDGGDIKDNGIRRRYFKLRGIELVGYHEITMKPTVVINMLKVVSVTNFIDKKDGTRNFTDQILFGGSIRLAFGDEETIQLTVENGNDDEKEDWYTKLARVVELNICHQPWVKKFSERLKLTDIN